MEQSEEKKSHAQDSHVLEICLSSVLFLVLLLLVSNVCVLAIAWHYNDMSCKAALAFAGKAVLSGRDSLGVMEAAKSVLHNAPNTFLVSRPEFVEFKDYKNAAGRALRIRTRALARLPAPFLIPNVPVNADGQVAFSRTYELQLNPEQRDATRRAGEHAIHRH